MRLPSWLNTCSSSTTSTQNSTTSLPNLRSHKKNQHASDSSTTSSSTLTSDDSSHSTTSTLQTNYSIQTLPSIPSLQKLSPQNLNFSISYTSLTSLTPQPLRPITSLAIHNNLLYAATENQINVYDRYTCTNLHTFNTQTTSGSTKAITFSNEMVFTTHQDCKIRVWNKKKNENKNNHNRFLTSLPTFNDRLRRFLLPKNYVTVRRHRKRLWIQHTDAVTDLAVSNGVIYSVSWDKTLKIWRISDLRCIESVKAHEDAVNAVAVSNDGTVYTGSADRRIRVWAKPVGEKRHVMVASLEKHKSAINALALNDDGSVLFSGACDRSILVWEREDSANHMVVSGALRGHQKAILCLINVSDLLLSGSADRTVRIWKRVYDGSFCCVGVLDGHQKPVKSLAAIEECDDQNESNGVVSVFSGSLDGEIKVWQLSIRCLVNQEQDLLNS